MIKIGRKRVAVIPMYDADMTPSGRLWIPDMAKERVDQGIVKYVGSEVQDIFIGDHVLFSGYSGKLLSVEGEGKLIVLGEDFVIAVFPDPPTTEVPYLYFKGRDGDFFPATFEQGMELLTAALAGTEYFRKIRAQTEKPKPEDYSRMRG